MSTACRSRAATAAPAWRRWWSTASFDLAAFRKHLASSLPDYARPLFLRIRGEMDVTSTFKQKKIDFVAQGFDPGSTADPIYFDDPSQRGLRADRSPTARSHSRRRGRRLLTAAACGSAGLPAQPRIVAFWRAAGPENGSARTPLSTARSRRGSWPPMRPPPPAPRGLGEPRPRARSRSCSCSISSRATCFAASARAFATDPLAARSRTAPSRMASTAPNPPSAFSSTCRSAFGDPPTRSAVSRSRRPARPTGKYAEIHADIIRRFGRFPHRNAVLGRATTPEEQAFLDAGGFAG